MSQDAFTRSKKLSDGVTYVPVQPHSSRVFTPQQELHIAKYSIQAAKMFYGLPMEEVRKMVYRYAKACGSETIPDAWERDQKATRDWYYLFMDRHPNLVLKAPEGMSIARIVAFNKVKGSAETPKPPDIEFWIYADSSRLSLVFSCLDSYLLQKLFFLPIVRS